MHVRVIAIQSLECLYTFILRQNAHQPSFPYDVIENYPSSLAHNSVFDGPNDFKFGTETSYMVQKAIPKFGKVDHHWHNHVFDDVI